LRASVHQGIDFPFAVTLGEFRRLNVFLHVACIVASNFSINTPVSSVLLTLCSFSCLFL